MSNPKKIVLGLAWVAFWAVLPAQATMVVDIGGGWQAVWDESLYSTVDINPAGVAGNAVFIQKSAEFTQGPVGGIFPSIPIVFEQIAFPAATSIVIDDEIIKNSTGTDWTDFHFDILNGSDAVFDQIATAESGGPLPIGFHIAPFTEAAFTPDLMRLDIWGGVLEDGEIWFPGNGASDGQLWIDVTPKQEAPFTVFTLKEIPTPEPASATLLAIGVSGLMWRRRRR